MLRNSKSMISIIIGLAILSACRYPFTQEAPFQQSEQEIGNPSTVFVHGTLFVFKYFVHQFDIPHGFSKAAAIQDYSLVHGKIAKLMSDSDPVNFPYDTFYFYGWSGDLSFSERRKAAQDLYKYIKTLSNPITLIGHSHGGSVLLELLHVIAEHGDTDLIIDRVVLLGTPVQHVTHDFVYSPNVRKVNVLYSSGDYLQILDPQGLYKKTKECKGAKFFSCRTFTHQDEKLKQVQILINGRNPWHIEFIVEAFIKRLPDVLKLLDSSDKTEGIIDIPSGNKEVYWVK